MTGALSNTLWSPAPPWLQCTTTFVPRSSWIAGAPSAMAASTSVTAASSWTWTWTVSAASSAWPRVSATTTATASPWNRIVSPVSG